MSLSVVARTRCACSQDSARQLNERVFVYSRAVTDWRDDQICYLVHFADGVAEMRRYNQPLREAGTLTDHDVDYVVTRVDRPRGPGGLGHAWAQPLETQTAAAAPDRPRSRRGIPLELVYARAVRRRVREVSWVESSRLTRSSNETHVR